MAEQQHRSLYSLAWPAAKLDLVDPFSDNLERPLVIVDQAAFGPVDKATVAMPAFERPALAAAHTGVVAVLQLRQKSISNN